MPASKTHPKIRVSTILLLLAGITESVILLSRDLHSLDARFFYSTSDIRDLFIELGGDGRRAYFHHETLDLAFISTYTLLIWRAVQSLYGKGRIPSSIRRLLFIPSAFDLVETTGILLLLSFWPDLGIVIPTILTVATPLKWITGLILLALVAQDSLHRRRI